MIHQKTCENFYSKLHNSVNSEFSNLNIGNMSQSKQNLFHKRTSSYSKYIKEYKCKEHNRSFYKYCIKCKEDICPSCYNNSHFIHKVVKYEDLSLNENQIKLFKDEYNDYIHNYSNLILKIKEWQNILNNSINELEEYINNIIQVINKMIFNYNIKKLNYNTIIEYRLIYSLLLDNNEEKLNNQKMLKLMKSYQNLRNYGKYKYVDINNNLSSISKEIILIFNDSIKKGNFFQKGNNILKFLFNNFPLISDKINLNDNINKFNKITYKKSIDKDDIVYFSGIKQKLNKSTNNICETSSSMAFRNLFLNENNSGIYEKKKPFDKKKDGEIFLDKEEIPIFGHNFPTQGEDIIDNIKLNNKNIKQKKRNSLYLTKYQKSNIHINPLESPQFRKIDENFINKTSSMWRTNNYIKSKNSNLTNDDEDYDEFDDINIDLDYNSESHRSESFNKRPIIFNNNINNFNNINNINNKNNYINNFNINKVYSSRNKKSKIYTHKKFNTTLIGLKNSNLLNKAQTDRNCESTLNSIDLNYFDTYTLNNLNTFSSINNNINMTENKSSTSYREKMVNIANKNNIVKEFKIIGNNFKIKKVKEFIIDINEDINMGFEFGSSECKIGIINPLLNQIELWVPYEDKNDEDKSGIPTTISLKDKNDNVIIGKNAEELKINNPKYTIYNFIKFIAKYSDEIKLKKEMKDLMGYKLYNNLKTERPYIKGNFNGSKNKSYNMEELVSIYLKNLFELLFNKIKFMGDKTNKSININIVITVPNYFNYFQRKVIEKIFLTQIFSNNNNNNSSNNSSEDSQSNAQKNSNNLLNLFGKYNIQIKNIKIENSSNLGYLYTFQKLLESNTKKNIKKNLIVIHIEGSSINISLLSFSIINDLTKKEIKNNNEFINKYEIKGISGTSFGEEDFTDNFIYSCLCAFTEEIKNECIKTPSAMAKLRTACEAAKKYFYKTSQAEINIEKLYDNIDLKMNLNEMDYERSCNQLFEKVNELIIDLLIKSQKSEKEIDDIIFIGYTTNVNIIRQKISKIFKGKNNELFNKLANNKYFEMDENNKDIKNEDSIIIGASLQSFYLYSNKLPSFKYIEISPISFGIEGLNKKMDFIIEKGSLIPNTVQKYVKIIKPKGDKISINIYEGEDEYVYNNRLISKAYINSKNFKYEKYGIDYIEILFLFIINTNFNLSVFILDPKTLNKKFECILNIDVVQK